MNDTLHALAASNVPRYTSYPTAPHFHAGVDGAMHRQWLGALDPALDVSVYVHVPFCEQICWYCACNTKAAIRAAPVERYVGHLLAEMELVAQAGAARRVRHLHYGGGTPNALSGAMLTRIVEHLGTLFDLSDLREHAIELDPRTLTQDFVRTAAGLGVTRASLGVQSLEPRVQAAIGRIQPLEQVARAVDWLRAAGIAGLNMDLMYGLPHQSVADAIASARAAAAMAPDRLAVFGYAHVPWFKVHQRLIDAAALPGIQERLAQAQAIAATLTELGYVAIGFDHYARADDPLAKAAEAGQLKRNFQGYTDDDAPVLIGLGASSISNLPQGYVQNQPDITNWARAIEAGQLPAAKGVALTDDDRVRRALIMDILNTGRADLSGWHADAPERASLQDLVREGLCSLENDQLEVTPAGRPFARLVARVFDARASAQAARHSLAV